MTRLARTIVPLTVPLALAVAAPAAADGPHLYHRDDPGYNAPLIMKCKAGDALNWKLYEGNTSPGLCPNGVERIYIRAGEELWIRRIDFYGDAYWTRAFDATGWKDVEGWSDATGFNMRAD